MLKDNEFVRLEKYPNYSINRLGQIFNNKKGVLLNPVLNKSGYPLVKLYDRGKQFHLRVHSLVALTFIPNPEKKPTVNHINAIKTDNRVSNLEWATVEEQYDHAISLGLVQIGKSKTLNKLLSESNSLLNQRK